MFVEFSFMGVGREQHKCHIALCDEPIYTRAPLVINFWNTHRVDADDYGSFVFHRNKDDEFVALTTCTKVNTLALEHCLNYLQAFTGVRCNTTDLLRIVREFDKLVENAN